MESLIVAICWQFFKTQGFLHCAVAHAPKHDINSSPEQLLGVGLSNNANFT